MRRSLSLMPLSLVLTLLVGCVPTESTLRSWWGPFDSGDGASPYSPGGGFDVQGFVHAIPALGGSPRTFVEVVLVGGAVPVSCPAYADYLGRVQDLQGYLDEIFAAPAAEQPPQAEWMAYACQELGGAARAAFGADGAYRAVHALLETTEYSVAAEAVFRPAQPSTAGGYGGADLLSAGMSVIRIYERSRHGEGILPSEDSGAWRAEDVDPIGDCASLLVGLYEDYLIGGGPYPDWASLALQAANHRYYHHFTAQQSISLTSGEPLAVGVTLPSWSSVETAPGSTQITVFGESSRAPTAFPYDELLLSSKGRDIPLQYCPELGPYPGLIWPELPDLPGGPQDPGSGGDDDDSAP